MAAESPAAASCENRVRALALTFIPQRMTSAKAKSRMTGLRHDGRFHEPNLDGTPGDYVSFDSWEWPQGVGLYGLVRLWQHNRYPRPRPLPR